MIFSFIHPFRFLAYFFQGLILCLLFTEGLLATPNIITLNQAKLVYVDSNTSVPPSFKDASIVKLTHTWKKDGFYGHAWYQLSFPKTTIESLETWAIYIPKLGMNAEVWLNDSMIGSGGSMTSPITRHWHSPLLFTVPTKLLNPPGKKINRLYIHVSSFSNKHGNLGKVHIAPEKILRPLFESEKFNSVTVRIIGSTLIFVLAIILFPVWLKHRNGIYFWFMISCLVWISGSVNTYITDIPFSEPVWEKTIHIILGWVAISFSFFMVRLTGQRFPKLEKAVLFFMVFLNITIIFIPIESFFTFVLFYLLFGICIGIISIIYLFFAWLKEREKSYAIVLISLAIIALCSIHDLAIQAKIWGFEGRFWLDYSIPLVFLMIGYLMVNRFLDAIEESNTLNQELESRVQTAQQHIQNNYKKIISLETIQAAHKERERIYRDLHDDLGSKLLSLVYRSETKTMTGLARSALNDLRNIVGQKPVVKNNLSKELKEWYKECLTRCEESKITLSFQTTALPENIETTTEYSNHLHRLITEAITNALKHGRGNKLSVRMRYRLNCLKIIVENESTNRPVFQWSEGNGIVNMRYRIEQLNGRIKWYETDKGTGVYWLVPLS